MKRQKWSEKSKFGELATECARCSLVLFAALEPLRAYKLVSLSRGLCNSKPPLETIIPSVVWVLKTPGRRFLILVEVSFFCVPTAVLRRWYNGYDKKSPPNTFQTKKPNNGKSTYRDMLGRQGWAVRPLSRVQKTQLLLLQRLELPGM